MCCRPKLVAGGAWLLGDFLLLLVAVFFIRIAVVVFIAVVVVYVVLAFICFVCFFFFFVHAGYLVDSFTSRAGFV